jgi:hypothetical protein
MCLVRQSLLCKALRNQTAVPGSETLGVVPKCLQKFLLRLDLNVVLVIGVNMWSTVCKRILNWLSAILETSA